MGRWTEEGKPVIGDWRKGFYSVKAEYEKAATPKHGQFVIQSGYNVSRRRQEVETALLLHNTYGGNIELIHEDASKKTADYNWRGKLWELKSVSSLTSVDTQLRKAIKQIENNAGGILLDISNYKGGKQDLFDAIHYRLKRSGGMTIDLLLLNNKNIQMAYRYKKR